MAVLLRLGDGERRDAGGAQVLADGPVDGRRLDEEVLRDERVAVVLHHARRRTRRARVPGRTRVKSSSSNAREISMARSPRKLKKITASPSSIVPDRLAVLDDHEAVEVLVGDRRVLARSRSRSPRPPRRTAGPRRGRGPSSRAPPRPSSRCSGPSSSPCGRRRRRCGSRGRARGMRRAAPRAAPR